MKEIGLILLSFAFYQVAFAQNEIGPDGDKLLYILLFLFGATILLLVSWLRGNKKKPVFEFRKVIIGLEKDRIYFPKNIKLTIKNSGNNNLDLDKPLLILDNFWLKRKFRLKGMQNHTFYPLFLEKGKTHSLNIDLNRFYLHDKNLKKYPKAIIKIYDVKGKYLGGKSVYLRKTLVKF